MLLEAQICDVWGVPIAGGTIYHTSEGGGLQVIDTLNDARTAELTLSLYDRASRHARPLDRVLSVTYGPYLIFKGPIVQPSIDFQAGTVTIHAHDPTLRLKHHYHRKGDEAVDSGYPMDGTGMRILIESAFPSSTQVSNGVPPPGILWGNDTSTEQGPKPTNPNDPDPGDGIWRRVDRGENVWDSIVNLSEAVIGPDFRFRPVDKDHPGVNGTPDPGMFCELDTADTLGVDKSDVVYFEHGLGVDNAENVIWEPDGDVVRNWFQVVYPGGESGSTTRRALVQDIASTVDYGIMQGWESSGQRGDSQQVLEEKAKAWVTAYRRPPNFFTVVPRIDTGQGVFDYDTNYKVGDTITARARKGERECNLLGRITSATIAAVDQAGNARVTLQCVPHLDGNLDPDDD